MLALWNAGLILWGCDQKNNPRNITHMPACPGTSAGWLFFHMPLRGVGPTSRRLDLEQNFSFMDGHQLVYKRKLWFFVPTLISKVISSEGWLSG